MSKEILAENLGPIEHAQFTLKEPGVTVLTAPNGSGKSILLEAVQAAAVGSGKLPLRDRTKKGRVEAFGAVITIGGTCRHTGQFEVTHIEGRFDLALLVDPKLKSPAAADKARIKALVSLTGVEAHQKLFLEHEAFADFETVVTAEALSTDDLPEMAAKIKDCYDGAALEAERRAEREYGKAAALIPPSDIDLDEESDATVLQEAYGKARDEHTRLVSQASQYAAAKDRIDKARKLVADLGSDSLEKERFDLERFLSGVDDRIQAKNDEVVDLEQKLAAAKQAVNALRVEAQNARSRVTTINRQLVMVDDAKKALGEDLMEPPDERDIQSAKEEMERAAKAVELGTRIREAKANQRKATEHRKTAVEAEQKAGRYRDAGKATDEVLSNSIKCPQLRVESDGKTARLVCDHPIRGKSIPYHELSEGERWAIAIDVGADQVGDGGLLVISQVGWEGIDGANRLAIDKHARERGVYILTAEAASDPNAKREIVAKHLADPSEPMKNQPTKAQVAEAEKSVPKKPDPPVQKTIQPPKRQPSAKPAAPPVAPADDDDIPF